MGNLTLNGATSGQITIAPPAVAGTNTLTLPAATGTVLTTAGGQTVSGNTTVSGTVVMGSQFTMRNKILNGAMVIDQRNAGASITPTTNQYGVDRWTFNASAASKFTAQQVTDAPTGFGYSIKMTSSSAYTVGAGELFATMQAIEGFNFYDLCFGTASAKTVTISFWVKSSLTGTFGGSLSNYAQNRFYPFTYTISSANTWEQKTVTITGDTSGTWVGASSAGAAYLWFSIGAGSSLSQAAGSWTSSSGYSATGATSVVGTNAATWQVTGVQLEIGTAATPFEYRNYQQELAMCQRYYCKTYDTTTVPGTATQAGSISSNVSATWNYAPAGTWYFPVAMRTQPTITIYSTQNANTTGVVTADVTDGAGTSLNLGVSSVFIRRNNNSAGVAAGADMRAHATASAEL